MLYIKFTFNSRLESHLTIIRIESLVAINVLLGFPTTSEYLFFREMDALLCESFL